MSHRASLSALAIAAIRLKPSRVVSCIPVCCKLRVMMATVLFLRQPFSFFTSLVLSRTVEGPFCSRAGLKLANVDRCFEGLFSGIKNPQNAVVPKTIDFYDEVTVKEVWR